MLKRLKLPLLLAFVLGTTLGVWYFLPSTETVDYQNMSLAELAQLAEEKPLEFPKQSGIDQAMLQDFRMTRSLKSNDIPVEEKVKAYAYAKDLLKKKATQRNVENVTWTERGPSNVGGRTRALMFDPNDASGNKVWAGGISGGLWYTNDVTDSDAEWIAVDDFMANLAISAIAYDPTNTQTFYMGTGEGWFNGGAVRGAGIWKSTDGGDTWNVLASTSNNSTFYYTQKIVVLGDGTVLAATHDGIMRSTDGGSSWTNVQASARGADIEVASNGTIYAAQGIFQAGSIRKSTDNGQTWTIITPSGSGGQRIELAVAPSDPNIVYAVASTNNGNVAWFKKTEDGGSSWTDLTIPMMIDGSGSDFARGQGWYDLILAVYPDDPTDVLVGGIDLHKTTDGGATWFGVSHWYGGFGEPEVHADQHAMQFKPGTTNEIIFGNDGGVYYSDDINTDNPSFSHTVNGYNVTQFYACAMANNLSNTYLAGSQDNGTHLFTEAGINATREVTGGDGAYCFINQEDANIMITSYVYDNYYVSKNGGQTFSDLPGGDDIGSFINPTEYDSKQDILYASAGNNQMIRITGVGTSASRSIVSVSIGGARISHIKVSPHTDNTLFVGTTGGRIFRLENAHETPEITEISTGIQGGVNISSIDVGSSNDKLIATVSNYDATSVYLSDDAGANWTSKEGDLPNIPVRWALFNPLNTNEVLIATELGVWATTDINATTVAWTPAVAGLANVRCDMLKYRGSDGQVAIATHGRGLFTMNAFEANPNPAANFTANKTTTYTGTEIAFTDASANSDNSWSWDFGDGNTSTEQNPIHIYTEPGVYTVSLSIANGGDVKVRESYISIIPSYGPSYLISDGGDFESNVSDFLVEKLGGTAFEYGSSTVSGKNGTSSGANAWVTGISENRYQHNSTSNLYTPLFTIGSNQTILSFKAKYGFESEWDGFIVQYTLDKGESWIRLGDQVAEGWYDMLTISDNVVFPPNTPFFSGTTNNTFVTKSFDISQFAGQEVGFRFSFRTDPASDDVGLVIDDFSVEALNAAYTASTAVTWVGKEVSFSDASISPNNDWSWDFGDNTTSQSQNPSHTYTEAGVYTVRLTVDGGNSSTTKTITVLPDATELLSLSNGGDLEFGGLLFAAENISGTPFELKKGSLLGTSSADLAWTIAGGAENYASSTHAMVYTANYDLSAAQNIALKFKLNSKVGDSFDGLQVQYSLNKGDTWQILGNTIANLWYTGSVSNGVFENGSSIFTGNSNGFEHKQYILDELLGESSVAFRFVFKSDESQNDKGLAIDDIEIGEPIDFFTGIAAPSSSRLEAYPNPVQNQLTLVNHSGAGLYQVVLADVHGKVVQQMSFVQAAESQSIELNMASLPSGIYFVKVQGKGNLVVKKLIKE
ncbi:PKD domain-containing protein [Cytophagales bacterium LB-30]|uniref:PKD domain-containing protein n=1 Tax=Shiella aurantiaca TaxID=3058365 RepID=A0ABT8F5M8_9BACT|nr:PKD domain-containing protein [Shiella aurantiaca]MDN4165664.1 PKD domain-containing protein [Shiella aurantiaca]